MLLAPTTLRLPFRILERDRRRITRATNRLHSYLPILQNLEEHGLAIHANKLLTYALFREQQQGRPGWETFADLEKQLPRRLANFEDYLDHSDSTLRLTHRPPNEIVEALAVGATLAAADTIFPVTDADFQRIPELGRQRVFDFEHELIASASDSFIELEAKGTHNGVSTNAHARSIHGKKASRFWRTRTNPARTIFAGVILDLQLDPAKSPTSIVFCDPPEDALRFDPSNYRLLARLSYYLRICRYITPRGRLPVALANRIRTLLALDERVSSLDGVPLVTAEMEPLSPPMSMGRTLQLTNGVTAFGARVDLRLTPEGVRTLRSQNQLPTMELPLCYVGLDAKVVHAIVTQRFEEILAMRFVERDFSVLSFGVSGKLHRLKSGLVVGRIRDDSWATTEIERAVRRLGRSR